MNAPENPDPLLAALRREFAHSWEVRAAIIHGVGRVPWEKVSKPEAPAFKRSIVDATLDLLETEAYWAHFVLDNATGDPAWTWKPYDRANAASAERLAMHAAGVERDTAERLARLPARELARPRPSAPGRGEWTAADVLHRVVTTNLVESGQISARLAALGVPPALPTWTPAAR